MKGKSYRLIYQLNKNIRVKIKTPVGVTQSQDTGPGLAQGSVEAAVISSVNINNGVDVALNSSDGIVNYCNVPIPNQTFMDDILKVSESTSDA